MPLLIFFAWRFFLTTFAAVPPLTPLPADGPASHFLLWQLADSAFPIGGFAHSGGVESAHQNGYVHSADDLRQYLHQSLHQTVFATLPFFLAALDGDPSIPHLDELLNATLSNHVANRASRAQGAALLATAEKIFALPSVTVWRAAALKTSQPTHFPIVLGALLKTLHVDRPTAVRLSLFMTCRGILSAAVRLGIVGPIQAQQIQADLAPELESLAHRAQTLTLADAAQTSPLLELLQSTQDRLYSRLFQS